MGSTGKPAISSSPTSTPKNTNLDTFKLPTDAEFYIERPPIEKICLQNIQKKGGALIRIEAPPKMGKTLLLNKSMSEIDRERYQPVIVDFQLADHEVYNSLKRFLEWFCTSVAKELNLYKDEQLKEIWDDDLGDKLSCTKYFEEHLLKNAKNIIVLGLDNIELIYQFSTLANDFFSLLRSWHEKGKRRTIWRTNFRLLMVYSMKHYMELEQSPFNVGLPVELTEFSEEQVQQLVKKYGLVFSKNDIEQLMKLVGGHPHLIDLAFDYMTFNDLSLNDILANASTDLGIYSEHLQNHLRNLQKDGELSELFKKVMDQQGKLKRGINTENTLVSRLKSSGLIKDSNNGLDVALELYRKYFIEKLK